VTGNYFDQFDPSTVRPNGGSAKSGNFFDQFDPATAKPEASGGTGSDIIKSLKVGTQRLPGMVTGLADLPFALAAGARPFTKPPMRWVKPLDSSRASGPTKRSSPLGTRKARRPSTRPGRTAASAISRYPT